MTFEAHTDATFLTLIPRASIAGLEVWTEEGGWMCPEGFACQDDPSRYVTLMPGEFLQLTTGGAVKAAIHRVTNSYAPQGGASEGGSSRLSMPLLVRGRGEVRVGKGACAKGDGLEGATMAELHAYLLNPPKKRE